MVKLVRERVLKLLLTHSRIEIKKDRRILFNLKHKTVLTWLDYWINFRADLRVFRQISKGQSRRSSNVSTLPTRQRLFERRRTLGHCIRQNERLEVSLFERTLHRRLTLLQPDITFALKNSPPVSFVDRLIRLPFRKHVQDGFRFVSDQPNIDLRRR